ncbi:unnamed protein product [Echinostoma caproni]|uniref:Uncharacterized protein n=1 Tax=Echinostoma caproni TaxID=27848 RepID=A0A183B968_9TREM|nr:unnamed protein product [Echinostoma caproni]
MHGRKDASSDLSSGVSSMGMLVLHKFLSSSDLRSLRVQFLETDSLNLPSLDQRFHAFLKRRCRFYTEQSWRLIGLSLNKLLDEFHLDGIIDANSDPSLDLSLMREMLPHLPTDCAFACVEDANQHPESPNDSELPALQPHLGNNQDGIGSPGSIRDKVFLRLRQLTQALFHVHQALDSTRSDLCKATDPARINADLYKATLSKIKRERL